MYVLDPSGAPTDPPEVAASASLGRIGPLPVRLDTVATGERLGRIDVPVSGTWKLAVTVRTSDIDELTRTTDVPIR
ncbi:hypothetical protein ABT304_19430 [Nocardioides sp. NPDC000445]|uniref:hypothetical protein n=1 Tax=Nocardioides sp. NPDC000445 TaxID=3154257 RepID=UPI00332E5F50